MRVALQLEQGFQLGEKALFGRALLTVGVADHHGHFVSELALLAFRQCGDGIGQRHPLEQDVLIQPRQLGFVLP